MQIKPMALKAVSIVALLILVLPGQDATRRPNVSIVGIPSEPIVPGSCKSSTAGYLEKAGNHDLTEPEIGHYIMAKLREGYILTVYPQTKRGIFVDFECTSPK